MDPRFWAELESLDPHSVCRRSIAVRQEDGYRLWVLGSEYLVLPGQQRIYVVGGNAQSDETASGITSGRDYPAVKGAVEAISRWRANGSACRN